MCGVHVEAVTLVNLCDEVVDEFIIERESAPTACALEMVVIRLTDPFEYCVAGAQARLGDKANTSKVAQYAVDS